MHLFRVTEKGRLTRLFDQAPKKGAISCRLPKIRLPLDHNILTGKEGSTIGRIAIPTSSTDLLVITLDCLWRSIVEHVANIGFIDACKQQIEE
jgi:hypothetical protein